MTDNISQDQEDHVAHRMPVRLVRGDASPEELAALVAILAAALDAGPGTTDHRSSQWNPPRQMVRRPQHHGPGGWRASGRPG